MITSSILISAIGVFASSVCDLLVGTLEEKDRIDIMRELVLKFHPHDRLYGVRSRRAGNRVFIDIEVGFEAERRVCDVEQDISAIRAVVIRHFKNACVTVVLAPEHPPASESGGPEPATQSRSVAR